MHEETTTGDERRKVENRRMNNVIGETYFQTVQQGVPLGNLLGTGQAPFQTHTHTLTEFTTDGY